MKQLTRKQQNERVFASFIVSGIRYNCVYNPNEENRKGHRIKYYRNDPTAKSFFHATDECRIKRNSLLPFVNKVRSITGIEFSD